MKILFTALSLVFAQSLFSQVPPRDSVVGVWVVKEAKLIEPMEMPGAQQEKVKKVMDTMRESSFEFNANGMFVWHFTGKPNEYTQQLSFMSNHKWSIDKSHNIIRIGDIKQNIAEIEVMQEDANLFFLLSETPLMLKVVKQK
jgi:hypothetical protein